MDIVFDSVIVIIGSSIGLITLGLVTGFSPVLYAAQLAAAAKAKAPKPAMRSLMLGVLVGAIIPGLLFLFFQPGSLSLFFNSTFGPIIVSSWFHVVLGIVFIGVGLVILFTKPREKKPKPSTNGQPATAWMLFSVGFLRTIFSVSGMVSLFLATQIISTANGGPITILILVAIFLIATLAPFVALYVLWDKSPETLENKLQSITARLDKIHYRPLIAIVSITVGILVISSSIIGL